MTWKQRKKAWRKAEKNRMMTLLQLLGLAGGLACVILIYLWIADERQMDHFGRNDSRLFQVLQNTPAEKKINTSDQSPGLLSAALKAEMPEVEKSVSVVAASLSGKQAIVSLGDTEIYADATYAGKDFFHLFAFPIVEGTADKALADRRSIAISKQLALKLFHRLVGVVGQTVNCSQQDTASSFVVGAVFDNSAKRSSSAFDVVLHYDLFLDKNKNQFDWRNGDPQTFVLLKTDASAVLFNRKLAPFLKTKNPATQSSLFSQNFSERYLHNHYENGKPSGGRIEYVNLFTVVAFVILFIACINFMNLATSFANERIKKAGIKTEKGGNHSSLAWQLLAESMGMCMVTLLLSLLLVYFSLPAFNLITGKQLSIHPNAGFILIVSGATALAGLAAGAYPALYLSGFKPLAALKEKLKRNGHQQLLHKML